MKHEDTYSETKTLVFENAVARVHFPDLTDEERARRKKEIGIAAGQLLLSKEKRD